MFKRKTYLLGGILLVMLLAAACSSGVETVVQAPQQPVAAAQPAPAAAAADPKPAASRPGSALGRGQTIPATAAPDSGASGEVQYGGIAVIAHRGDPVQAWDPTRTTTVTVVHPAGSIWDNGNLVRTCLEDVYQRCPGLATEWEVNDDFTEWTFKIRDGVFWHDGTPFTVEDAKFWFDLSFFPPEGRQMTRHRAKLTNPKSIEILKDGRLKITLVDSSPNWVVFLGQPFLHMAAHPRHLTQPEIDKGNVNVAPIELGLVGLGPYTFKEHKKGSFISVRRFDKYWDKDSDGRQLPYLDGIDFPIIPDMDSMAAAFRVGRLDGGIRGNFLLPELKERIEKAYPNDVWFIGDGRPGYRTVGFNVLKEGPWQDVRVRKAISMWIDRQAGSNATRPGGEPRGLFHPDSPWANPDFRTWPGFDPANKQRDRAEAKRLMAEAGYPNGFKASFLCRSVNWVPECEFFAEQLRTLGVDVTIDMRGIADYEQAGCAGDYDLRIGGGGISAPFPESAYDPTSSVDINPCATVRHQDTKIDDFFKELFRTTSYERRLEIARELERYLVLDQAYLVTSWTQVYWQPFRKYVHGVLGPGEEPCNYCAYSTVWMNK